MTRPLLVTPQRGPTRAILLGQFQFQLRPHDLERAPIRLDGCEQRNRRSEPLAITGRQVQIDLRSTLDKLDFGPLLVDLLQVKAHNHTPCGLVEIVAHRLKLLFRRGAVGLFLPLVLAHVAVSLFGLAPLDLHELVKLQDPPLAARPALTTLVKDRYAGVVYALFLVARDLVVA